MFVRYFFGSQYHFSRW